MEEIKDNIVKNAKKMFEIDPKQGSYIIKKYLVNLEKEVLMLLEEKDQLSFIDAILSDPANKAQNDIKLMHI